MTSKEKEYIFDSLVFRFKDYQQQCFELELLDNNDRETGKLMKRKRDRNLMRFIEILNELMNEIKTKD